MKQLFLFKLIFRSWWRNKLFAAISLISLAIGITCTNLLITFVIHEYTIESSNPNKDRILRLTQEMPVMKQNKQGTFVYGGDVPGIISRFPEIEKFLRLDETWTTGVRISGVEYPQQMLVKADSCFLDFFPYETVFGSFRDALTKPGSVAVSEELAQVYFGKGNYENQTIDLVMSDTVQTFTVAAIFKPYSQSTLQANILTSLPEGVGASCMVMLHPQADLASFRQQLETTELPTLLGKGHYFTQSLQESYFNTDAPDAIASMNHRQIALLGIGLLSALLVLIIACFNYVNLSFSRLLKQVRMLRVETLMGATHSTIRKQLFLDTFLTVFVAFLLSILLMNDLLPHFNNLVSAHLTLAFLFSSQVFPLILLFVFVLSVVPAFYMIRKMHGISESSYRRFFSGSKRRNIVSLLVIFQFVISISLMMAFLVIRAQLNMTEDAGSRYQGIIELGDDREIPIAPLYNEIKNLSGVVSATASPGGIFGYWSVAIPMKGITDKETLVMVNLYNVMPDFLTLYNITLQEPERTAALLSKTAFPVIVNESFVHYFIPEGENPIGQPMQKYSKEDAISKGIIVGIANDFNILSMNNPVSPVRFAIRETPDDNASYLSVKLDQRKRAETMVTIQRLWEKHFPSRPFAYEDTYEKYLSFNKEVTHFSRLLFVYSLISLLLTAFGLFGIAWYAAEQRRREIGIRKVNGASAWQIIRLLNVPFLCYVLIASVIAFPVTYLLMQRWLEQFVYRTDIGTAAFIYPLFITLVMTLLTVTWNSWRAASSNPVDAIKE